MRVKMLISIETYRTYDFPGGGGGLDPIPPLDIPPLILGMHSFVVFNFFLSPF